MNDQQQRRIEPWRVARQQRFEAERERRRQLREAYEATPPRDGLCAYDAQGMDIVEGRRA
jgi:hypothetical protein